MRVFVTGNRGQLGKALQTRADGLGLACDGGDLPDWDMLNAAAVLNRLRDAKPDVVIHAAALTAVDYCAEHPEEAVRVNGVGSYNVALACRDVGALLVAVSSNEVFDGTADRPYQEYDSRRPINAYGYSKFVAEQVIERFAPRYMIVRTAWLYAPGGKNFIHRIVEKARSGEPLKVVTDEISGPTNADDLAEALFELAATDRPGLYHLTNAGECSRYDFAREILRLAGLDAPIMPTTLAEFQRPSTPPHYSPLANIFAAAAGVKMRPWQEALADYVAREASSVRTG